MNSAVSAGRIENRGSKPRIFILVPVFNEAAILDANVREIIAYCVGRADRFDFELLVIIYGASDNSAEIADRLATEFASIRVLRHPTNFGVGQALRYGFSQSKGDIAIVLDVDLSYGPEHIELLVDKMVSTRAKLVLAAPYMPGGRVTNVPWIRKTLSRWGNRFLPRIRPRRFVDADLDGPGVRRPVRSIAGVAVDGAGPDAGGHLQDDDSAGPHRAGAGSPRLEQDS